MSHDHVFGLRTRALHAGTPPDPSTGARAMPIYFSSSFVFDSTEHAAELFALRTYGNIYSRIGNPTVAAFEERMASLEGGLGGIATASGLSAQLIAVLSLAQAGDHRAMAADELGGRLHHDVGAPLDRPAEHGRGEGVVDYERQPIRVRGLGPGREVGHVAQRIADRLGKQCPRLGPDRRTNGVEIVAGNEGALDAHAFERHGKLRDGAAVKIRTGDQVVARLRQREHSGQLR